ncbi:unnamed protein product, partial [marine sediment metagenome]
KHLIDDLELLAAIQRVYGSIGPLSMGHPASPQPLNNAPPRR